MFNRNSLLFGVLLGIGMPLLLFGLLYAALAVYNSTAGSPLEFDHTFLQLVSPIINLFLIRYYFVNKKFDDTGRGLLLVTFIYVIAYFVLN